MYCICSFAASIFSYNCFLCFQIFLAKLTNKFRWKAMLITDSRVRTMNEILNSIKLIKMYAWEDSFEKKVAGKNPGCCVLTLSCRFQFISGQSWKPQKLKGKCLHLCRDLEVVERFTQKCLTLLVFLSRQLVPSCYSDGARWTNIEISKFTRRGKKKKTVSKHVISLVGLRKNEKKKLRLVNYIQNINTSITSIIPTIATVLTFTVHTLLGLSLNTSEVSTAALQQPELTWPHRD